MNDEELRALAEAATPGPWSRDRELQQISGPGDRGIAHSSWEWDTEQDLAFIAAANPTAVLALLDERDALRAQVELVRALADRWGEEADTRGQRDQVYTAGVAGMLLHALDSPA